MLTRVTKADASLVRRDFGEWEGGGLRLCLRGRRFLRRIFVFGRFMLLGHVSFAFLRCWKLHSPAKGRHRSPFIRAKKLRRFNYNAGLLGLASKEFADIRGRMVGVD